MNRIDRLVAILIHLQSKKVVTAREVANRFEISLRTVYRDIRALEEAGVPLGAEAGKGYFISEGYHLPPVMFTNNEAAALLTAGKMVEKLTDSSLVEQYNSALYKIRSVLRNADKEYMESLDSQIVVLQPPSFKHDTFPNNYITLVHQALTNKYIVQIEYFSSSRKEFTIRNVEPLCLCFYGNKWHLIAFCKLRGEYRDFRMDRTRQLKITYEICTHQQISINDYFSSLNNNKDFQSVVVQFPVNMAQELYEQKYYYGFINEVQVGDSIEMTFLTNSFEWMTQWLMGFDSKIKVVSPDILIDFIKQKVEKLKNHYL